MFLRILVSQSHKNPSPLKRSLSRQLLSGFGISLIAVGVVTLWIDYRSIHSDLHKQVQKRAQSIAQGLEFATEGLIETGHTSILERVVQNYATLPAVIEIAIVSPDGRTLAQSSMAQKTLLDRLVYPELTEAIDRASITGVEESLQMVLNDKPLLVEILPFSSVLFGTSGRRGIAIAILDLKQMQQEAWSTFFTSSLTMFAGILVILLFMWILIQKTILEPLHHLNESVSRSQNTGKFAMPISLPANEISFLATTFDKVFKQLESYNRLHTEVEQRKQVETALRDSEAREREKSQQLQKTLVELRKTQSQLIQTEKMSSLGRMVSGVAHEINNPVSFIYGNLAFAREYFQNLLDLIYLYQQTYPNPTPEIQTMTEEVDLEFMRDDFQKLLGSMKVGADRIRDIVISLRNFSRLEEADLKLVDIHEGIESTLLILENRFKETKRRPAIAIVKEYGPIPPLLCYAGLLNQVFLNILTNAIDAIEEKSEITNQKSEVETNFSGSWIWDSACLPTIHIRTEFLKSEVSKASRFHPIGRHQASAIATESSSRIAIHIKDNGHGIPEEVKKHMFDPFFTTKPIGKGTGLGLSISYQIVVDKHGGELNCFSQIGEGTEFSIEIPMHHSLLKA